MCSRLWSTEHLPGGYIGVLKPVNANYSGNNEGVLTVNGKRLNDAAEFVSYGDDLVVGGRDGPDTGIRGFILHKYLGPVETADGIMRFDRHCDRANDIAADRVHNELVCAVG